MIIIFGVMHKIYLCIKVPNDAKYQYLINRRENIGLKELNNPKCFIK